MMVSSLFFVVLFSSGAFSANLLSPCKRGDSVCVQKSINTALPLFFAGLPELGLKSMDPLSVDEVVADLPGLYYKFINSSFVGAKNTVISNLKADKELTNAQYDLIFTNVSLFGKYEINGTLFGFPIEGSGDYLLTCGEYIINVDAEIEKVKGDDGKTRASIKTFKIKCHPIEPVTYDFKNLFNGREDLAKSVQKFANENWLQVAELVQEPNWKVTIGTLVQNFNNVLKYMPIEDFLLE